MLWFDTDAKFVMRHTHHDVGIALPARTRKKIVIYVIHPKLRSVVLDSVNFHSA